MARQSPHQYQGVESELEKVVAVVANVRPLVRCQPVPSLHGGAHCPSRQHYRPGIYFRISRHDRDREAKKVLAETGASHVSLHNFFGLHKANTANIKKLLTALKRHTKPVRPAELGVIGQAHLYAMMETAGGEPKTFSYTPRFGVSDGVPRVIEFAFGIHRDGLDAGNGPGRRLITGVNWSPGINNPFRSIGKSGDGLDAILEEVRARDASVICCLHVARPRVAYTDRGKSAIVVEGEVEEDGDGEE